METFATTPLAVDRQHELRRTASRHRLARLARRSARTRAPVEDRAPARWALDTA
jgi:hypothetical protein